MKIGLFGLLTLLFVSCKLAAVIDWPWWMVLAPLWGSFLLGAVILGVCLVLQWKLDT